MFRYYLLLLLLIATIGCAPNASESTETQSTTTDNHTDDDENHDDHAADDDGAEHDDHIDDDVDHDDHAADNHENEDSRREHDAHEHGAAELTIAWSGNRLAVDLDSPAFNVLGFEYAPSSDAEIALADESVQFLEAGTFLQFTPAAECVLISADIETEFSEEEHEEEEHDEEEATHSDIEAAYAIECQQPDELTELDMSGLFDQFPNFEDLQVQWISDTQQSADTLTPNDTMLSFE